MINKYIYNSNYYKGLLSLYNRLEYYTRGLHPYIIFIGTIAPQIHLISKQPKRKINKMNYSDFIEAVQSNLEIEIGFNKLQKMLNNYINSGLLGDPYANEENEFDDGDIDNAIDMIETDYGH